MFVNETESSEWLAMRHEWLRGGRSIGKGRMKYQSNPGSLSGSWPDIHSIGISVWDPIYSLREHIGLNWEVVHIVRGVVKLHLGKDVFRGKSGDTLLVPAQTPHRDEFPLNSEFEVLHIVFQWKDAPTLFPCQINRDLAGLPLVDKQTARELAFETYACFKRQRLMWQQMTSANLYRLLLFLHSAAFEHRHPKPASETVAAQERRRVMIRNAKAYIQANLGKPIMLADIAAHLSISAYHLSHLFSEESGFTLSAYLINSRMERAAELLRDPRRHVSEIAYAVGFEDPNYFSKAFRRHFGCAPVEYRARRH